MTNNSYSTRKFARGVSLAVLLNLFPLIGAFAAGNSVQLGWDASPDTGITGYHLYYGTASRNYAGYKSVATTSTTITNLAPGTTYYFAVTAKNGAGVESSYSAEVTYTEPAVVNNPPAANAQSVSTMEDVVQAIALSGSDPDGNSLTYTILTQPANGTLSGTAPNLTYAPALNFNGSDSFTFRVSDGSTNSTAATVSISVAAVNDAPVANNQTASGLEDTAKMVTLTGTDVDGNTLSYSVLTQPAKGTLSGTAPNLTYTPNANVSGSDSFTFRVSDGLLNSATATMTISIAAANDTPVANAQNVAALEDTAKAITLTGSDVDGNTLSYSIVNAPAQGTLSGTAPNLTYTPAANYSGNDSFTFRVGDGTTSSAAATVSINVAAVNDAPIANAQNVAALEDTAKTITLTGSDQEGSSLVYTIVTSPANGTLSGTAPNLTYLPATNYFGADAFTFRANDGVSNSAVATVSISIAQQNQSPIASAQSVTTAEDTAKTITLAGSDPDNNPLTYSIVTGPVNGTLSGTGANLNYTPAANYNGGDTFTFKVNDGKVDSAAASVSIAVTSVNDVPVANVQSISTLEDTTKAILLTGSDADGNNLTFAVVGLPTKGSLSGTAPNLAYTPNTDTTGADSFTFKVNDGTADSSLATVTINVNPVNDPPLASAQSVVTLEDTAKIITLAGTDLDGNALVYSVVNGPANGTLTGTAPNLTYRPATNFNGADSFSFKVNDGTVDSATAAVSINISAVNDAPIAVAQSVGTDRNVAVAITLGGTDVDGDALTYTTATQPSKGVLGGTAPNLTYTPNNNVTGTDSFSFQASDGNAQSTAATVSINVAQGPNTVPVASAQSITTAEDSTKAITLTGTDADDDALTYAIVAAPAHGSLSGIAPNVTYTPTANYTGSDNFTFKANDGTADSAVSTVALTVTAVNDAPVAAAQSVTTMEDTAKSIVLSGSDVDGDNVNFTVLTQPTKGTLSGAAPNLTYTPNANATGSDSFTFRAGDGTTNSAPATVAINITPANDVPEAVAQSVTTTEDTAKIITLAGTDADGNALTYAIVSLPAHGTLSGSGATRTYTPAANYNGSDNVIFKVNDGTADSSPATVSITVAPANDLPVADVQSVTVPEDTTKAITLTGSDTDGDALIFTVVDVPTKGTLTGTAPNLTYTPGTNYQGADSFTFRVNDGTTNSAKATVSISVTPVNDSPVAVAQSMTTVEDTAASITLSATDADGNALTYAIVTPPSRGTLTGSGASRTYTPSANYTGADTFWFKANDGTSDSELVVVSITVTPANDTPVANSLAVSTEKNTPTTVTLTGSDIDGDPLTFALAAQPTKGALSGTAPNLTYTPNNNVTGSDSFTYRISDGSTNSALATVNITIAPGPNTAPTAIAQSVSTAEDTATPVTLTGSDADGDTLSFTVVTPPVHGTLSGIAPNLTYTPATNYSGDDTLWFKVNDGTVDSSLVVISMTVTAVNDPPVANAQSMAAVEATAKAIVLTGSDVEGASLTFAIVTAPAHGSLSGSGANVSYTAAADYSGADSFTFRVNDGAANSAVATVSITVSAAPNATPTAIAQSVNVAEDAALDVTLVGTDTDNDPLTYTVVTQPSHGTLSGTAPNLTYKPATNYSGLDSFTFRVNDGEANSAAATVSINVTPVNDTPTLNAIADVTHSEGSGAKSVSLAGISAGAGESQTLSVTASSSNPSLVPTPSISYSSPSAAGALSFTPVAESSGTAVITVTVNDGQSQNNLFSQTFTVNVTANTAIADPTIVLSAPIAGSTYNTAQTVDLTADVNANGHTISKVQFFAGTNLVGEAAAAPYTVAWDCDQPGNFSLLARLLYDTSESIDSPMVGVTVNQSSLPGPWNSAGIGSTAVPGNVQVDKNRYLVQGAGMIEGTEDSFMFVHQPLTADGEVWVQIADLPSTGKGSCAGIMIRESLNSSSRYMFIGKLPDGNLQVRSRSTTGGATKVTTVSGGKPSSWIRLVRKGDMFVAGHGRKAGNWSVGAIVSLKLAPNVYTGITVASGDPGTLNQNTFVSPTVKP
jgi:VCBS repeat-containing protein